jgi:Leucine-rich repeat (LRR) protein
MHMVTSSTHSLTELNLSRNKVQEIPPGLGSLSKLVRLDLRHNQIASIHPAVRLSGCVALAELYLGNNGLEALPPGLEDIPNLQVHIQLKGV